MREGYLDPADFPDSTTRTVHVIDTSIGTLVERGPSTPVNQSYGEYKLYPPVALGRITVVLRPWAVDDQKIMEVENA